LFWVGLLGGSGRNDNRLPNQNCAGKVVRLFSVRVPLLWGLVMR